MFSHCAFFRRRQIFYIILKRLPEHYGILTLQQQMVWRLLAPVHFQLSRYCQGFVNIVYRGTNTQCAVLWRILAVRQDYHDNYWKYDGTVMVTVMIAY